MRLHRRQKSRGRDELDLLHAAELAQVIAQRLQALRGTLYQQDLERLVVLEQHVLRGDDLFDVRGLSLREGLAYAAAFGAIDECDRAGEHGAEPTLAVLGELVADQL